MPDSFYGVFKLLISRYHHLRIIVFYLQKVPKFTFNRRFTVKCPCNLDVNRFIISCGDEVSFVVPLPPRPDRIATKQKFIVNSVLKYLTKIPRSVSRKRIP